MLRKLQQAWSKMQASLGTQSSQLNFNKGGEIVLTIVAGAGLALLIGHMLNMKPNLDLLDTKYPHLSEPDVTKMKQGINIVHRK